MWRGCQIQSASLGPDDYLFQSSIECIVLFTRDSYNVYLFDSSPLALFVEIQTDKNGASLHDRPKIAVLVSSPP